MIEECFFLHPPDWLTNPPRPASTRLFKTYVGNSPALWPPGSSTHHGIYCMGADGAHLSGHFGLANLATAQRTIEGAWTEWRGSGAAMKPVPTNSLALYAGEEPKPGSLKLQVAYRDLPRGDVRRPDSARFQNPYNLGWLDLSAEEARHFITTSKQPVAIPDALFRKLATATLKDAVRGQMSAWKPPAFKEGSLTTQLVSTKDKRSTFRLSGSAKLAEGSRSYSPKLHGFAIFDHAEGAFERFELIAAGQRAGKGGANGRETDLGPAPMGVAFKLFPTSP